MDKLSSSSLIEKEHRVQHLKEASPKEKPSGSNVVIMKNGEMFYKILSQSFRITFPP